MSAELITLKFNGRAAEEYPAVTYYHTSLSRNFLKVMAKIWYLNVSPKSKHA